LKARAHRASAKAKDAAHTKSKAAKAHRAGKAKASDAKATQNKRHKVAKAPKVIPAGPLATKSPATRVAVDISKRPQTLKGGRIAVQGQASPGAAVTIVVRDARGRILGLGKSKATARGFFFEPVSLRAWKGQGFLKVTASAVRFNDMRRTSFGASLSQAERKQLASG
jgi:hypothetical protein